MLGALALLLVSAGIEDVRTREIANWKNATIALLAPLWWWLHGLSPWPDLAIQLGVAITVLAVFWAIFHFGGMGGGDVKMIAALALWFPLQTLVWMLIVMSLIGGALTMLLVIERAARRKESAIEVPYGVAIAIAALISLPEPFLNHFL